MKKLILLLFLIALPLHAQEATDEPFPPEGWVTAEHGQLRLIARVGLAGLLRDMFAPVYDLMAANTGRQPRFQLLVVEDGLLPGCTRTETGEAVILVEETPEPCAVRLVDLGGYDLLEPAPGETLERALARTLLERFYPTARFPAWFASGLADFYAPSPKAERLLQVRNAARANRLFSLPALEQTNADPLWEAQSYGMMLYILDRAGVGALFALAADPDDFATAYQRHVGEAYAALLPNWQNWIFTRAAEIAHGITPYQLPTPAPTATLPPTATLTATTAPTATATLAATSTQSRAPTVTPSRTWTPYPATVTPRPPGSPLIAPTETPSAPQSTGLPQPNVVTLLIVLLVILIVVYVVLSYRR
ncbi:MAG: hypothetical protein J0M07_17535 [Anaerolineae bacterium]|nr:hypothetical protein [Anaerolineae bacterium]